LFLPQELRHFRHGLERLNPGLSSYETQFLVDVRLHEIGEVQAVLSPGKLDRGHAVGVGNVGIGTMGQKQFDHFAET
jgi:hypothetical protein